MILSSGKKCSETGEVDMWPDYSVNDYVYRPDAFENISFYEFTTAYERIAMSFQRMSNINESEMPILHRGELGFLESHPGRRYCYLKKSKKIRVPKLSMPKGMMCDIEESELNFDTPSETALVNRENYAKIALILFYPFRDEDILALADHGTLWDKLKYCMADVKFWEQGKNITKHARQPLMPKM